MIDFKPGPYNRIWIKYTDWSSCQWVLLLDPVNSGEMSQNHAGGKVYIRYISVTIINMWDNQLIRRKYLFWLTVAELQSVTTQPFCFGSLVDVLEDNAVACMVNKFFTSQSVCLLLLSSGCASPFPVWISDF